MFFTRSGEFQRIQGLPKLAAWPSLILFLMPYLSLSTVKSAKDISKEVVFAINAGGERHVDVNGIVYAKDPLQHVGIASDFGTHLFIHRVPVQDQILYQTERYHTSNFGYDIPVSRDGWYLLVLKFSEVYFNAPNKKVFDVVLNGDLKIASDLDIFELVGKGTAHDEYMEFEVKDGKILLEEDESEITGGKIRVEFIKSYGDNPKVNAIVLMKGRLDDWPQLPELLVDEDEDEYIYGDEESEYEIVSKNRKPSGPKARDPYETYDSSTMLPLFVAIGAFIPLLFCMCKL